MIRGTVAISDQHMTSDTCCKVSRVTAEYGISDHALVDSIDVVLATKWLGEGRQPNTALRLSDGWSTGCLRAIG